MVKARQIAFNPVRRKSEPDPVAGPGRLEFDLSRRSRNHRSREHRSREHRGPVRPPWHPARLSLGGNRVSLSGNRVAGFFENRFNRSFLVGIAALLFLLAGVQPARSQVCGEEQYLTGWGLGVMGGRVFGGDINDDRRTEAFYTFYRDWGNERGIEVRALGKRGDEWKRYEYLTGWGSGLMNGKIFSGDVNGDHRTDMIYTFYRGFGDNQGVEVRALGMRGDGWKRYEHLTDWDPGVLGGKVFTGDVNGDRRTDVIYTFYRDSRTAPGIEVRALAMESDGWKRYEYRTGWGPGLMDGKILVGDINGDGRSDLLYAFYRGYGDDPGIEVRALAMEEGGWKRYTYQTGWGPGLLDGKIFVGDINGDGRDDLIFTNGCGCGGRQNIEVRAAALEKDGWKQYQYRTGWGAGLMNGRIFVGDIDGDRRTDVIYTFHRDYGDKPGIEVRAVALHEDGWQKYRHETGWGPGPMNGKIFVGDVNGDERADVIYVFYRASGPDQGIEVRALAMESGGWKAFGHLTGWGPALMDGAIFLGDVDGDRRTDVFFTFYRSWSDEHGVEVRVIRPVECPRVKITHSPVIATSNQTVEFVATLLDEGTGPTDIIINVDNVLVKRCQNLRTGDRCWYRGGPYPSSVFLARTVLYRAVARDGLGEFDASGYYHFAVTDPDYHWSGGRVIPARRAGQTYDQINIVFHRAGDYGSVRDFIDDVTAKIWRVVGRQAILEERRFFDRFNFYVYENPASADDCGVLDSNAHSDMTFQSINAVLHTTFNPRDCALGTTFTAEGYGTQSFLHESGHAVFDLGDEYDDPDCETFYFATDVEPNIFATRNACRAEQTAKGRDPDVCDDFTECQGDWWGIHQSIGNTIMHRGRVGDPWGIEGEERVRWVFRQFGD